MKKHAKKIVHASHTGWKLMNESEKLRAELREKARQSMPKLEEPVMRAAIHEMQLLEKRKRGLEDDIAVLKRFILKHSPMADESTWKNNES